MLNNKIKYYFVTIASSNILNYQVILNADRQSSLRIVFRKQ